LKRLVVLSGSGISAESGIPTFRGAGGLWRGYDVTKVASPEAWESDPGIVLDFYNERRKVASEAQPNRGHEVLAELQENCDVQIITQNVDDLHERAGSSNVIHLHGSLFEARSTAYPENIYPIKGNHLKLGDVCEYGSQLRPNIVWFGEPVPAFETALLLAEQADLFVVVGTSLSVYPAAGLIDHVAGPVPKWIIDPQKFEILGSQNITHLNEVASSGLERLKMEIQSHL